MSHRHERDPERWLVEQATCCVPPPDRLPGIYRRVEESLAARSANGARGRGVPTWAFAAGAFGLVAGVGGVIWWRTPAASRALDLALEAQQPTSSAILPVLDARYQGSGHVLGTERDPRIAWSLGRIDLELVPGAGVDLTVETSEAQVRVTGTRFAVERDARGTLVELHEGHVTVGCLGTGAAPSRVPLTAGQHHWCLPCGPSGLLGRARKLQQLGELEAAEQAADRGLSLTSGPAPARGELLTLAMELRLGRGDEPAALEAASAYLREGYPARAHEVKSVHDTLAAAHRQDGSQP